MTNPPSLTLCQELHKLAPGWTDTYWKWVEIDPDNWQRCTDSIEYLQSKENASGWCPIPDTDYLLEKLPHTLGGKHLRLEHIRVDAWEVGYPGKGVWQHEENLVEALMGLAIALIQEGKIDGK